MRLATITTTQGPRLHVRGRSGYLDVAEGTGDPRMSELAYVLAAGEPAMSVIHRLESQDGREFAPTDFAAAVPAPPRILCLGLNYSDTRWRAAGPCRPAGRVRTRCRQRARPL